MVHVFLILRLVLITIGPQISWVKFIDKGEDEKLYGMDISKSNLYLAGGDLSEDSSFIFLKLDNSGSEKLSRLYWESGSGYEIGNDLAVFPSGNIVITGWYEVGHLPAWYTLWIDSLGERLYDDSMPIDYNGYTYNSNCVEPFSNGQCYVGGWFGNQTNQGIRVAKYDSQGKLIWKHFLYESNLDRPVKIAIDSEESVYALSEYHCTWIGWSKEGNQLGSVKDYIFSAAEGAAIRVNPTNHVFISGDLTESDRDFMLLKYDTDGNLLWPSHKAYDLGGEEECRDMALDAVSDCYLTGYQIRGEEEDAAIVKTDSAGNLLWAWVDTVPGKQEIEAIEVDEEGYVYLAGSHHNGEDWDMLVMKLRQPLFITGKVTDSTGEATENVPVTISGDTTLEVITDTGGYYGIEVCNGGEYTVQPNLPGWGFTPSSRTYSPLASRMLGQDFTDGRWTGAAESQPPKTFDLKVKKNSIAFSVPCTVHVEIGLYDVSGRLIKPLINGNYGAGFYQVELEKTDISPGVYFVRMNACDFTETRKVVTL